MLLLSDALNRICKTNQTINFPVCLENASLHPAHQTAGILETCAEMRSCPAGCRAADKRRADYRLCSLMSNKGEREAEFRPCHLPLSGLLFVIHTEVNHFH